MNAVTSQAEGEDAGCGLSAEALAVVRALEDPNAPPPQETDVARARSVHALARYDVDVSSLDVRVEERTIESNGRRVRVRVYSPPGGEPRPVLVFAHGGCWVICSLDSHDALCRYYCHHARCVVVSVDYALAPERPYPEGLDDFCAVLEWCFGHAGEIGGDAARIGVAGDSAGGNLCAAAAQRLQGDPARRLRLQLLIYPICDVASFSGRSMERYATGYFFERAFLEWTVSLYARDADVRNPDISPLHGEVTPDLAPAMVILAECDILRDQGAAYAEKLRGAGVPVQSVCYDGVPHAFVAMAGALETGRRALEDSVRYLDEMYDHHGERRA